MGVADYITKIKEFLGLKKDYIREGIAYRQDVLDELINKYGRVGLVPLKVFEEQADITKTRDDLIPHFLSDTHSLDYLF